MVSRLVRDRHLVYPVQISSCFVSFSLLFLLDLIWIDIFLVSSSSFASALYGYTVSVSSNLIISLILHHLDYLSAGLPSIVSTESLYQFLS